MHNTLSMSRPTDELRSSISSPSRSMAAEFRIVLGDEASREESHPIRVDGHTRANDSG